MATSYSEVKVFSETKARERNELGEKISAFIRSNPDIQVVDTVVTQSSDQEFHCLTIILFFNRTRVAKVAA